MSELTREEQVDNIIRGLETTLTELQPKLYDQVDGLSTKQLRRALKASINYITAMEDDTKAESLVETERQFLGGMFAAIQSAKEYHLNIISKLSQEYIDKQNDAEKAEGETNE